MTVRRLIRFVVLPIGGACIVAVTAGCQGGNFTASGSFAPESSTATTAAPSVKSAGGASVTHERPVTTAAHAGVTPECKAANLKLALGPGDGAGAGNQYPALQFTNVGRTNCVLSGFPGVSFVAPGNGEQVGAAAGHDGPATPPVTLAPGRTASAVVRFASTDNYPAGDCNPVAVAGFRVYPPDDTTAMFVRFDSGSTTACSSTRMPGGPQLSVQAVKAGSGNE
jgi:hypothetical protein